ncbi:MAG: putative ABC exporter domain-containing protein [Clostridiales bacterium]|nr:putative ABC exporter domain-containing protein [Clostridiales bacterium]
MSACIYVLYTQFKNRMKKRMHSVQFWVAAAVVILYFAFYFWEVTTNIGETHIIANAVPRFQSGATFVFMGFTFLALIIGVKRGSSFFSPADISNMFVSPISPNRILMYGILRQFSISLIATLFLLMQLINLRMYFGLWIKEMLILMIAWLMISLSCSILSIALYSLTATHPILRKIVLVIPYILAGGVILGLSFNIWRSGNAVEAAFAFFNKPFLHQLPIGGWTAGFLIHAMAGEYADALMYASLTMFLPLLGIFLVSRTKSDYYEDVLTSTGNLYAYSGIDEKTSLLLRSESSSARVGRSKLFGKRSGTAVLFQRQLTEQRRSLFPLFDQSSLLVLGISILLGATLHSLMKKGMYPQVMSIFGVLIMCYVLFFSVATGRLVDELRKPYIYIMPGGSVKKLFYTSLAIVWKACIEGLICFSVVACFARLHLAYVPCATLFYASAALFFAAVYLTSARLLTLSATKNSRMVLTLLIITAVFIFEFSVGMDVGRSLNAMSSSYFPLTFLILSGINLIAALIFFNCAKGMLENYD